MLPFLLHVLVGISSEAELALLIYIRMGAQIPVLSNEL